MTARRARALLGALLALLLSGCVGLHADPRIQPGLGVGPADRDEVLEIFRSAPRIAFLQMSDGLVALNSTLELMTDLGRPRGDMWEVGLWADALTVRGNELFYNYQVYNQAIVVPETVDAIRALTELETDGVRSIAKTDRALGLVRDFVR